MQLMWMPRISPADPSGLSQRPDHAGTSVDGAYRNMVDLAAGHECAGWNGHRPSRHHADAHHFERPAGRQAIFRGGA